MEFAYHTCTILFRWRVIGGSKLVIDVDMNELSILRICQLSPHDSWDRLQYSHNPWISRKCMDVIDRSLAYHHLSDATVT